MFQNGDIVLNFRRSTVYVFERGNKLHLKEYYYCRMATLHEQKLFKSLSVDECKLSDIGLARDWKLKKTVTINLRFGHTDIFKLNRVGESHQLGSYEDIIRKLLTAYNKPGQNDKGLTELADRIKKQDEIFKQLIEIINKSKK